MQRKLIKRLTQAFRMESISKSDACHNAWMKKEKTPPPSQEVPCKRTVSSPRVHGRDLTYNCAVSAYEVTLWQGQTETADPCPLRRQQTQSCTTHPITHGESVELLCTCYVLKEDTVTLAWVMCDSSINEITWSWLPKHLQFAVVGQWPPRYFTLWIFYCLSANNKEFPLHVPMSLMVSPGSKGGSSISANLLASLRT